MKHLASGRTRLLIRPGHVENESLRGYVSRVSSCNGSSPQLKPMLASLRTTTDAIPEIATLTGCKVSILRKHGTLVQVRNTGSPGMLSANSILSADQVWLQQRMFCPVCLSENGVSSCCWEMRDYDVCHKHGCYLVDRCSGCDRVLSWTNSSWETCFCGVLLADIKPAMASTNRRSICSLIADAMSASNKRVDPREFVSDSLTPLNWLFIVSNFLLSSLIPGFCQEHLGRRHAMSKQTSEELLLVMLKDQEYCDHLRQLLRFHDCLSQMTMTRAFRAGIFDQELRKKFLPCFENVTPHSHLFKMKADVLEKRAPSTNSKTCYLDSKGNSRSPISFNCTPLHLNN